MRLGSEWLMRRTGAVQAGLCRRQEGAWFLPKCGGKPVEGEFWGENGSGL